MEHRRQEKNRAGNRAKNKPSRTRTPISSVMLVLASAFLASVSQILYKLSWRLNGLNNIINVLFSPYPYIGLFLYGVAFVFLIAALRKGELSVLYPFLATSFLWVSLFSVFFLNESFGTFKILGFASVVIGIVLLGRGSQ